MSNSLCAQPVQAVSKVNFCAEGQVPVSLHEYKGMHLDGNVRLNSRERMNNLVDVIAVFIMLSGAFFACYSCQYIATMYWHEWH